MSESQTQLEQRLEMLKRVDPKVVQTFLLDEIAGRLLDVSREIEEVKETLKAQQPLGIVEPSVITVSDQVKMIRSVTPWISFSIYNRDTSDNTAYVRVNKRGADAKGIAPDSTWGVSMTTPMIKEIYVYTASGGSATIELTAVR